VETRDFLAEMIGNTDGIVYKGRHRNDYIFFRPQEWEEVPAFNAGKATAGFFRFVFHNSRPDRLILFLESTPGDREIRRRLFEMGQKDQSLFNYLRDPNTTDYPKYYRRNFLTPRFYEEVTDEDREKEIRRHWSEFLEEDLPRIDSVLQGEEWIWQEPSGADSPEDREAPGRATRQDLLDRGPLRER
jgi:hypothetical protein